MKLLRMANPEEGQTPAKLYAVNWPRKKMASTVTPTNHYFLFSAIFLFIVMTFFSPSPSLTHFTIVFLVDRQIRCIWQRMPKNTADVDGFDALLNYPLSSDLNSANNNKNNAKIIRIIRVGMKKGGLWNPLCWPDTRQEKRLKNDQLWSKTGKGCFFSVITNKWCLTGGHQDLHNYFSNRISSSQSVVAIICTLGHMSYASNNTALQIIMQNCSNNVCTNCNQDQIKTTD